eukprot:TRINITY_DN937_c0_g1_i2.p2 TRINITY_DN937_c0_g1~~TRINITY_DN937_c0_g1_i2.p2  ORF type:complete len:158 (+),score=59.63 TRINITY_DN937_c0_g1_i2:55-528(+)
MSKALLFAGLALCVGMSAAQSWTGNYYRLRLEKESGASIYTIHGLWPEWSAAAAGFCRDVSFNETAIADLSPQMQQVWPSDKGPDADFWTHEWQKHGSCADNMTEHQYFSTALKLYYLVVDGCPHAGTGNECNFCWTRDLSKQCACTSSGAGTCDTL